MSRNLIEEVRVGDILEFSLVTVGRQTVIRKGWCETCRVLSLVWFKGMNNPFCLTNREFKIIPSCINKAGEI